MRALLETTCVGRSFDQMRGWSIHCAERVLESSDRIEPEVAVLNRERVVHRWPLRWEWLADDRVVVEIGRYGGPLDAFGEDGVMSRKSGRWIFEPIGSGWAS